MQTLVSTLLLATTLSGAVQPAPLDWTETPTGPERAVLYTADKADNAFWSVGITLEQVGNATAFHPLALRWDGKNWLQTEPAIPDGRLDDVLVRSANDVWAVGATEPAGEEPIRPVLQHWTGTAWSLIDTPLAPPGEYAQFTTVAAQGDDLLIGQYGDQSSVHRYADGVWQELPREGLEHIVYLDDLEVVSDKEVWAAGLGGLARYDGVRWTKVDLPVEQPEDRQFEVAQLVVRSADDIWAVGLKPSLELWRQPLALHYDGKTWTEIAAPAITGEFHDLEFIDGKPVAIGGNPETGEPLIAELAGKAFVQTTTPPGSGYLHGSIQDGSCLWAVGVAAPVPGELEQPLIAVGTHRRGPGHGFPTPTCKPF